MTDTDTCKMGRCRRDSDMIFYGLPLCDHCYEKYCDDPGRLKMMLLKKMDAMNRNQARAELEDLLLRLRARKAAEAKCEEQKARNNGV